MNEKSLEKQGENGGMVTSTSCYLQMLQHKLLCRLCRLAQEAV